MEHLKQETVSGAQLNMDALYKICPQCFTESKDPKTGEIKHAVDFEKLRLLLGDNVAEGDEQYDFTWVGKRAALQEAAKPIRKTLRPCPEESVDWENTKNLYIEGDNLEVLKLLQNSYMGKVKMIYIDPPYNTGNDFVYQDDFHQTKKDFDLFSGDINEEGERLVKNTESNGRFHSDWCSMIYSRLMVARSLLTEDGVIFISIDDNEVENLRKVCDEVFGELTFVSSIIWQKNYSAKNNSLGIPATTEYLLVYSKLPNWAPKRLGRTEEMNSKYKNPDNDFADWRSDNPCAPGASTHQGMVYAIQHPFNGEMLYPYNGACWRYQQEDLLKIMNGWCKYHLVDLNDAEKRAEICGISAVDVRQGVKGIVLQEPFEVSKQEAEKVLKRGQWPKFYFTKNGEGGIARKTYITEVEGRLVTSYWPHTEVGHTDGAKKELKSLFDGKIPFDTPKPTQLVERMLEIATDENSIVLDFFSGSATTAHAVFEQNAKDKGNRSFILIQLNEDTGNPEYPTICEIGKERIRRAGKKIMEEQKAKQGHLFAGEQKKLDVGFRVFKCADSNMKDVYYAPADYNQQMLFDLEDNIKEDRNDLDLLFGCMLDWGVTLDLPLRTEKVDGVNIHIVNEGDLVACFEKHIPESVIDHIASLLPMRVVLRDSCFDEAKEKMNFFEIFKQRTGWSEEEVRKNVKVI